MASLTADAAEAGPPPHDAQPSYRRWSLLNRLEKTATGAWAADGSVAVRRREPAGCVLYGPYWHLRSGCYRLAFRCRSGAPRLTAQPVLGVEIIVLSRFQRAWRDFTAAELAQGDGSIAFAVPPELSADGGNEARFEFRFFHLGNAALRIDAVELVEVSDDSDATPDRREWRLLGRLHKSWIGRRRRDGSVAVGPGWGGGCVLYGGWPYLRLGRGRYRVSIRGRAGPARLPAQPVIGAEVLGRSRWYSDGPWQRLVRLPRPGGSRQTWRDFLAAELNDGAASLEFAVPTPMASEAGADAPFDLRLYHLGNADVEIDAVDLHWLGDDEGPPPPTWRLLGRMRKATIGRQGADGVAVDRGEVAGRLLSGPRPPLYLGEGQYRLTVSADIADAPDPEAPALRAEAFEVPAGMRRTPLPPGSAQHALRHEFTAAELAGGSAAADFAVPAMPGGERRYRLVLSHLGTAALRVGAVELRREIPAAAEPRAVTRIAGRKKLVFIGNCQCSILCQAFNHADSLNKSFETKYHFVQLRPNLREFARRDIEECDVLLIQDIDLWNEFPLRDCVPPNVETVRFPLVRFASLWPFDAWNGPGDREAHELEAPNSTFPFLDGLLARLRREIPDREQRFRAYRALDTEGVVNYRRMHALEERRLLKLDQTYDCRIGEFTLENFRSRQVFHTTVRPNWQGFNLLLRMILKAIGASAADPLPPSADTMLRIPQVPVHPKVARDLGVTWADEKTRYLAFGREMTWEAYIRRYIEHYG